MSSELFFEKHLAQTTPFPLGMEISRAQGIYLYGPNGERYIDFISGIGVSNLGHGQPTIIAAIQEQVAKHLHVMVYGEFVQSAQTKAAAKLTALLPSSLDCCYFVNSGAEAIEAAMKLVKRTTGRYQILSFEGAYHGNTQGAMSVSFNEKKKSAFRPLLPGISFLRLNHWEDLEKINHHTAGVFLETIQGDAGIRIPNPFFMKALRERCTAMGAMLVLDEIQCGMGRTGKLFAFEHYDILPDVLVLGKALGGGMPIGAIVTSTANMRHLSHSPLLGHISTFAGHPVACAAAAAALDLYGSVDWTKIEEKGQHIYHRLSSYSCVQEIRFKGLYFAIDLADENMVQRVVERCMQKGLITFWFLSCPWSFRIAPPIVITDEELSACLDILSDALAAEC
jgi:acetylornithine/succinyldiaminopimelate/putrescine aminotransferase